MTIPLSSDHSWDHAGDLADDQGIARSIDTWNRSDLSAHSADCCRTWAGSADPDTGDRCKRDKKMYVCKIHSFIINIHLSAILFR
jgi:hypothetical protein